MHLVMFDIDGTLVDSYELDGACYLKAAEVVLEKRISYQWDQYKHATDAGILNELIDAHNSQKIKSKFNKNSERNF